MQNQPRLLEGVLTELHHDPSKENLLRKVHKHYETHGVISGLGGIAGDLFGQAASGAALAMYEGENTQCFACLIDDKVVCGEFAGAEMLKNDERVKAIVSLEHGVLYAHALMSPDRGLLWVKHPWGDFAELIANFKIAAWGFCFVFFMLMTFAWVSGSSEKEWIETIQLAVLGGGGLIFIMALWAAKDMKTLSGPSTLIFQLLGFARPQYVNLNNHRFVSVLTRKHLKDRTPRPPELDLGMHQMFNVFDYKQAIEDGKVSMVDT